MVVLNKPVLLTTNRQILSMSSFSFNFDLAAFLYNADSNYSKKKLKS